MAAYLPGTIVWVKLAYSVWWPARVVDASTVPVQIQKIATRKKSYAAIVQFDADKRYEVVVNKNNLELYSSPNKIKFLEIGYSKFIKQINTKTQTGYDMKTFVSDIKNVERQIGGDINIFKQFEKTNEVIHPPININELFVSSKDLKKRKKENIKRSTFKPLVSKQDSPRSTNLQSISNTQVQRDTFKIKSSQSLSYTQLQRDTPTSSNSQSISYTREISENYVCYFEKGCTFSTKKYDILKRHIAIHKNEKNNDTVPNTSNTNKSVSSIINTSSTNAYSPPTKKPRYNKKQTNIQKPQPDNRIIKLHYGDGDNENEIAEQYVSKSQEEDAKNTEKNTESADKNSEMCTNIYSRNDYDDTSEDSVDEDFIKHLTDRVELPNDSENSRSLLTKTGDTSNQISVLEESLKVISIKDNPCNSLRESDSNIFSQDDEHFCVVDKSSSFMNESETNLLTKDDDNISVDNVSGNYLNISISSSNDIINETNLNESTVPKRSSVGNSTLIGNEPVIDGNINPKLYSTNVYSTDSETQVFNLDSNTDNSHGDANMEDTESDCDEGDMISKLPTPDWVNEESWESVADDLLKIAKRFTTLDKPKRHLGLPTPVFKTSSQPFTPVFSTSNHTPPIFSEIMPKEVKPGQVIVPLRVYTDALNEEESDEFLTDEELLNHPVYLAAMEAIKSGNTENVAIEIHGVDPNDLAYLEQVKADMESSYNQNQS